MANDRLGVQADLLAQGLQAHDRLSNEALNVMNRLDKVLLKVNKLVAPIYNRATALTWAEQNISEAKQATEELLGMLDVSKKVEAALLSGPQRDLDAYLKHVSQLDAAMSYLEEHGELLAAQEAYGHAEKVYAKAMRDCENDFAATLSQQTNATLPSTSQLVHQATESLQEAVGSPAIEPFAPRSLERLRKLARVMLRARHMTCMDLYAQVRSRAVEQVMRGVGFEPLTASALQVQSAEQVEKTMAGWTQQLRVLVVVVSAELRLTTAVWDPPADEALLSDVVGRVLRLLIQQGRDMCDVRRGQPHKVFVLLDMNSHLTEVLPLLEQLLGAKDRCAAYLDELRNLHVALARAARTIFLEFEDSIANDSSKVQTVDGTVHPLCAATLAHLRRLFTYGNVGRVLFNNASKGGAMAMMAATPEEAMAQAVVRVMMSLLRVLETKSKAYKSPALANLFLMNNVHYMVWTVEQSEQLSVLGREWIERHKDIVEHYGSAYQELTWGPIIKQLAAAEGGSDSEPTDPNKWREWVKKQFKTVNKALETIYTEQSGWTIPDARLKASVRKVILQDIMPPYERFYNRFAFKDFTSNRSKYIKFHPEDLEHMVEQDLFETRQMSVSMAKTAHKPPNLPLPGGRASADGTRSSAGLRRGLAADSIRSNSTQQSVAGRR